MDTVAPRYDDDGNPVGGAATQSVLSGARYDDSGNPLPGSAQPPPPPPPGIRAATAAEIPVSTHFGLGPILDLFKKLGGSGSGAESTVNAIEGATPLAIGEAAPSIAATLGGLAGGAVAGPPGAMGGAALGGMAGVGPKRAMQAAAGVPITPAPPPAFHAGFFPVPPFVYPVPDAQTVGQALFPKGIPSSIAGDLTQLFGEGSKQAVFEGAGQLFAKALRLGSPPDRIMALAEELGLPTKPQSFMEKLARRTIAGRHLAGKAGVTGRQAATEEATTAAATLGQPPPIPEQSPLKYISETQRGFSQDLRQAAKDATQRGLSDAQAETEALLTKIAPEATPSIQVGRAAQSAARTGVSLGRKEAERLYDAADALNKDALVDISGHVSSLKQLSEEAALSPTQDPAALVLYAKKLSETVPALSEKSSVLKQIMTSPGVDVTKLNQALQQALSQAGDQVVVPYLQARELQKWLGQRLSQKVSGNIPQGRLKLAWSTLTDSMEQATSGTEGGVAFAEATRAYKDFADIAKRGAVPVLVERFRSNPEDVIALMARGPSRVQQLRKAIVGFAEQHGTLPEQASAHEAWDQAGRLFAEEKILDGGIKKLPERLASVGDETLDALYGRDMANNFRTIASSVKSLRSAGPLSPSPAQQGALYRLQDLDAALRLADDVGSQFGMGMYSYGGGVSIPLRPIVGTLAAAGTAGATEVLGGLITWAATNRARTRWFTNAAAEGFQQGLPATARLVNSYLDYQRDMALLKAKKQGGSEPASPPPPPAPPPAPPAGLFSFLH